MNLRASTTGPMPSLPSWSLATRQSSSPVLSAPPGPPATSLTLPATQFTPSAPRPSRRPHNSVVTTSLRSQLLPTPLPSPPPAGPCCADLLTTTAPYNVLRATALQAVEGTTETIISARPISSSTQGAVAAAYITITTYITNVDIKHTDAVTTTAIILTSTPPPSPPPPLYAVDCLPVVEADSSAEYHRETCASHLPVRGGGDSPRNPLLLLPHIDDTERTKVKWTQTTSVVDSGDRIVQTHSHFTGMLFLETLNG
ncbi:hypothetical protein SprV_0200599500 [Sparganum proliferum]